ncbi:MAG: bifunctional diaminohydroxyphosphoribosylaminopyrimidine deaminase/5-amino-6-(5-phosphoribosylamino)uracil reductase RibD [marine benthic group bacterium]|nr:bifunctional diaminohydroxyphosphoribosylaminopyrimidine deaminase/5-amino-6-(5-phosphoribosylamino)uracil reductase RibD [Gemmatimonadota bacterium]
MRRAIELSLRGEGRVEPNPRVGAVVVSRDGEIVGEGYHERFGASHAEVEALERAGAAALDATLFVTLEPCTHQGKTPPCTRRILESGIRRVVVASRDPNPAASGGVDVLRSGGLQVDTGLLAEEAATANAPFLWWHSTGEPFLALKLAVSLDGRIAERPGARIALSGPEANHEVMRLRAAADAVLIGSGTARSDDPLLTVRSRPAPERVSARVVLDSRASLSATSKLVLSVDQAPLILFTAEDADPSQVARLEAAGVVVERVGEAAVDGAGPGRPGLDLNAVFARLVDRGFRSVLCEGGAVMADSLIAAGRVQRLHWHLAPRVMGPGGVPALTNPEIGEWVLASSRPAGNDVLIEWNHARLAAVLKGA